METTTHPTLAQSERNQPMKLFAVAVTSSLLLVAAAASAQTINDAQIASIVVTANQVDIDAGTLAKAKASDVAVRQFGELMVSDHSGVNQAAVELVPEQA